VNIGTRKIWLKVEKKSEEEKKHLLPGRLAIQINLTQRQRAQLLYTVHQRKLVDV
jgi:hypothetical protein